MRPGFNRCRTNANVIKCADSGRIRAPDRCGLVLVSRVQVCDASDQCGLEIVCRVQAFTGTVPMRYYRSVPHLGASKRQVDAGLFYCAASRSFTSVGPMRTYFGVSRPDVHERPTDADFL